MLSHLHLIEPNNFFSDLLLAAFLWFWAQKLDNLAGQNAYLRIWKRFFALIAVSAFVGAWGHLLSYHIDNWGKMVSWAFSIAAIFLLELELLRNHQIARWTKIGTLGKMLFFAALLLTTREFSPVKMQMTLGIVFIVLPMLFLSWSETREMGFLIVVLGLMANGISGLIHTFHVTLSAWCDHRDLAHFVSIVCFGIVFLGLRRVTRCTPQYAPQPAP